ncbi:flavonol synthase/flavanone 3-hydroxylase [Pyrus ussuriensis x Pyrus communis]|uniref:Flavonol synthase/flavanone 3-hydroxylase n=1 Tax=Pyrus ussuriensis x Pyrus communis TaxID=2448454 RepID=A0A5N5HMB2_9ROSA|nr:flavonol synthase/flavanone 3-hydroxylase [Pyrus ussuriensis x Pyrus communis]
MHPQVERVQDIASISKDEIPEEFISIQDDKKILNQIIEASREWGMYQIVNHDIPNKAVKKLQEVGRTFFELPQEEKEVYAKPPDSKSVEVDHLFHRVWRPSAINYQFWPKNPRSYRLVRLIIF